MPVETRGPSDPIKEKAKSLSDQLFTKLQPHNHPISTLLRPLTEMAIESTLRFAEQAMVLMQVPEKKPTDQPADGDLQWPQCKCHRCTKEEIVRNPLPPERSGLFDTRRAMMILCDQCGNKRCPHANDHRNECTHSNEPGQKGSAYE